VVPVGTGDELWQVGQEIFNFLLVVTNDSSPDITLRGQIFIDHGC
jgi:hypothetical protein